MQLQKIRITNPEAALALRDTTVLHHFLEPKSPSEVAKKLSLAANLVHHHARRAVKLGLLFEARREKRQVFYQLCARTFTHSRDLLTLEQKEGEDLKVLTTAFLEAYRISESFASNADDPDYAVYSFATADSPPSEQQPQCTDMPSDQKHPTHFQARTLHLDKKAYTEVVQAIAKLLLNAETQPTPEAESCSLVFMGFTGAWRAGHDSSSSINSFMPLEPV